MMGKDFRAQTMKVHNESCTMPIEKISQAVHVTDIHMWDSVRFTARMN